MNHHFANVQKKNECRYRYCEEKGDILKVNNHLLIRTG